MDSQVEPIKATVRAWSEHHKHAVLYDDESTMLLDVASGKSVRLRWRDLKGFEEKVHPETKDKYLVLLFQDGSQIALIDPGGVAFAPSTKNTGSVGDFPPVVCLKDFFTLKNRIDHYLYDHPDEPPPRESLQLVMICIATLDGARTVGFDIADLEAQLDTSLREIERRTP